MGLNSVLKKYMVTGTGLHRCTVWYKNAYFTGVWVCFVPDIVLKSYKNTLVMVIAINIYIYISILFSKI